VHRISINKQPGSIQLKDVKSAPAGKGAGLPAVPFLKTDKRSSEGTTPKEGGETKPVQRKTNKTGLPDNLKTGVENLSGFSMDDTRVHYNSAQPAQLNALAYAQGSDIHIAPGQEKHLAHEAWHVVQQKQGRVKPTLQMKTGININDDTSLEREADQMGARALQRFATNDSGSDNRDELTTGGSTSQVIQGMIIRIRGIAEMMHISKPTIMNASLNTKHDMAGSDKHKEDYGITKAVKTDTRKLDEKEELRIVGHGSEPTYPGIISSGIPKFGGFKPDALAQKISTIFPANYSGAIYLDGCYTGMRLDYKAGTSYLELFTNVLCALRADIKPNIRGNIGPASTSKNGQEVIALTPSLAGIAKALNWPVNETVNPKTSVKEYHVVAPLGLAFCNRTGAYNDMGITKMIEEQRAEALEKQRREEAPTKLKPEHLQTFDPIWNDLL